MVTLAVQATGIAIIATGMVLVIVSRNIDLSVGSLVGLIAMTYALLMTDWLPGARHRRRLPVPLGHRPGARASALGAAIGALQGFIIAYIGVPSFIVTLGGLLSIRGRRLVPVQRRGRLRPRPDFQLIGGGREGSIGGTLTWVARASSAASRSSPCSSTAGGSAALRLPAAADVGRGPARPWSAAWSCSAAASPTRTSGREPGQPYAGARHPEPAGGCRSRPVPDRHPA